MDDEWLEIPVFIRGITPVSKPLKQDAQHKGLLNLINIALKKRGKMLFVERPLNIEWGWDNGQKHNDRYLAEAQLILGNVTNSITKKINDLSFNPFRILNNRLRHVFVAGFSDMFYYISSDGEKSVRRTIFNKLSEEIHKRISEKKISLTILAHSAGSVIAHDILFHLFGRKRESMDAINKLRKLIMNKELRIRKFYTFGSPLTPMIFRADSLLMKVIKKEKINPEDIGFLYHDNLTNPRWVNFWDKDDIASFPIEFLYETNNGEKVVEDKYLDLGDRFPWVHSRYWKDYRIADYIAKTF